MRRYLSLSLLLVSLMLILPVASAVEVSVTYSANWAGYVATAPTPFTSISATWFVPYVSSTIRPAYSAIWVGIGGWYINSNTLIQAGTAQNVQSDGTPVYYAWYEVYPQPLVNVCAVSPGDSVEVSIYQVYGISRTPNWLVFIKVKGVTKLSTMVRVKTNFAAEATAEFIVERPLIRIGNQLAPLANFGIVYFSYCFASGHTLEDLTSAYKVIMTSDGTSSGTVLASPSEIITGYWPYWFTVTWYAAS